MPDSCPGPTLCYRLGNKKSNPLPAHPGGAGVGAGEHLAQWTLWRARPDVDKVFLQQPLLMGDLLKVLGLVSVLLHLSVQHLQHGL